ncbi:MAG TPA: hypothetical protein VKA65_13420 [Acidimicrobiales bacterium]|nr:hypothetical protein [Acidimicrobiales bacterium]
MSTVTVRAARPSVGERLSGWLFSPVPAGRVAAFRTLAYLFVPLDLLRLTPWVARHGDVPGDLYQPLFLGRLLHLPVPTEALVQGVWVALLATSLAAATGRAPRLLGTAVAVLYAEWMFVAMSYGKVDHDRFGYMVALFALATAGPARHGEATLTERGGWALRVTQMAAMATYFLAAFAKLRYGGPGWMNSATLTWAVIRRGTDFGDWLMDIPGALVAMQWFIVVFELSSPLIFLLPERVRRALIVSFFGFHVGVFAAVRIAFFPHLVALAAFLPLERLRPITGLRRVATRVAGHRPAAQPEPATTS